ncbi:MAG TPA: elongation factor G [Caldisericia bacterium]|nr:elongation factor G [Caldisericia bacterium]HPO28635.1 elongation factor G [Caldisericia bacterium]HQF37383.1 elongation factor G [Candidatus Dojkabacteria bacterium]HXK70241.1 elongation factor G [Caldisericia bacterium]
MKHYSSEKIRNIAFVSHGGAGKTSFVEACAYNAKIIERMGKVTDGNTISDYEPEEIKRGISINLSIIPIEWSSAKINIIDTPGYFDFVGEVITALRVVESALVFVDAIAGIQVGTEKVVSYLNEFDLPFGIVINKMDRENIDFDGLYDSIKRQFGLKCVPVYIPYYSNGQFAGLIDVINGKAILNTGKVDDVPAEFKDQLNNLYEELLENTVEADDSLMEKYLTNKSITKEEFINSLKLAIASRKVIPIMVSSGINNAGVKEILNFISEYFPSPIEGKPIKAHEIDSDKDIKVEPKEDNPLTALVFKTMTDPYVGQLSLVRVFSGSIKPDSRIFNSTKNEEEKITQTALLIGKNQEIVDSIVAGDIGVLTKLLYTKTGDSLCDINRKLKLDWVKLPIPNMRVAIIPKTKNDEDKLGSVIPRIQDEDLTLKIIKDEEIKQTIIYGMGDTHLQVIVEKLKRKFGVNVELIPPKIPYKETIKKSVKSEGKYKKQTGGHGQYGHCWLEISPLPRGSNFEFESKIFGGAIPKQYIPAIEKGVVEAMQEGILAGYPVVDIKVVVFDGSYHPVDSSELAFKIAASMALKKGLEEGDPILLEPIMSVKITIPESYLGAVIDDLNTKRGRVLNIDSLNGLSVINAEVPMVEMQRYTADLNSISGARGYFEEVFSHYEEAHPKVLKSVLDAAKQINV